MISVEVKGLEELKVALAKSQKISAPVLSKAINAVLNEVLKEANEPNPIFQFKLPREKRTGYLVQSFNQGLRFSTAEQLWGWVGPTAFYASIVHERNPFMNRIIEKVQPKVDEHFQKAMDLIAQKLADATR